MLLCYDKIERDLDYNTLDTLDKFSSRIHGRGSACKRRTSRESIGGVFVLGNVKQEQIKV